MAQNQTNWYPPPGHPRQDTDRIIFDNIYQLRNGQQSQASSSGSNTQGASYTITFANNNGFTVGGKAYHSLTFANGLLISIS